jgi:ADP-heptose:LPS heptosyltransferase
VKENTNWNGKRIVISRTDSIGDVLLTLPVTAWLKSQFPDCHITFLCKNYTAPIVRHYSAIDDVLVLDELEQLSAGEQIARIQNGKYDAVVHVFPRKELAKLFKKAKVLVRIGTSHRLFHFLTCNVRPNFTRKGSPLHEAQLNFELMRPFGLQEIPEYSTLHTYTQAFQVKATQLPDFLNIDPREGFVILHPKSQGSAREWPMDKYIALAQRLMEHNLVVLFTGTEKEGALFRDQLPKHPQILDTTGKLTIDELILLISRSKALVACSTGPLHIAGFLGIRAVGLFAPKIPIHPGRWQALGERSIALVNDQACPRCMKGESCNCIAEISVDRVFQNLLNA